MKIFQIYYDEATQQSISPIAIPHDNTWHENKALQPFFENDCIVDIFKDRYPRDEHIGIFSWQFESKNQYRLSRLTVELPMYKYPDVVSFFRLHTQRNIWAVAENWHKGIIETSKHIFSRFDKSIDIMALNTPIVYQNAHLTKSEIYSDYVHSWLEPLMGIMLDKNDAWLQERLWRDTFYKKGQTKKETLKRICGVDYYPLHPFIAERFFSTYLAVKNIKVKNLC